MKAESEDKRSAFARIREHPVRSLGQLVKLLLLAAVTAAEFLSGIGFPLLIIAYLAVIIALAVTNIAEIGRTWWIYLIAAAGGTLAARLLSLLLRGLLAAARQNLLVSAFGRPAGEAEGGAVPSVCAKPFDPAESALLELERQYNANLISKDEYERRRNEIKTKM